MSINKLLKTAMSKPIIELTPFQAMMLKRAGLCLAVVPLTIVAGLGLYAIYEAAIQILWGILNFGQFRTYNMAKIVAQIGFVVTLIVLAGTYVHQREQAKTTLKTGQSTSSKKVLNEAA